mmetsp:Transcript_16998/g.31845  ORF Transcript_16998/g.31845 Transcript_16998/m.31845 type:complete len:542 (-) Transcript_16998:44-1669(-)
MTITLPIQVTASNSASKICFERGKDGQRPYLSVDLQVKLSIPELLEALVTFQKQNEPAAAAAAPPSTALDSRASRTANSSASKGSNSGGKTLAVSKASSAIDPWMASPMDPWQDARMPEHQFAHVGGHFQGFQPLPTGGHLQQQNVATWLGWRPPGIGHDSSTMSALATGGGNNNRLQQQNRGGGGGTTAEQVEMTWTPLSWLESHTAEVKAVAWAPDGSKIATVSCDNTLCMWNVDGNPGDPKVMATLCGSQKSQSPPRFTAVAWAPDSKKVITGSSDASAHIWRCRSESRSDADWIVMCTLRQHTKPVTDVCWSRDGTKVGTCSIDGSAIIWHETKEQSWEILFTLLGHRGPDVKAMAWSPNSKLIVTCGGDKMGRIWSSNPARPPEWTCIAHLDGHAAEILSVAWSPEGNKILTGSADHSAWIWSVNTMASNQNKKSACDIVVTTGQPAQLRAHTAEIRAVAWSPQGQQIATSSQDKTARVWREIDSALNKWILVSTIREHSAVVLSVAWSPDGSMLLTGSGDNRAAIWQEESEVLSL